MEQVNSVYEERFYPQMSLFAKMIIKHLAKINTENNIIINKNKKPKSKKKAGGGVTLCIHF